MDLTRIILHSISITILRSINLNLVMSHNSVPTIFAITHFVMIHNRYSPIHHYIVSLILRIVKCYFPQPASCNSSNVIFLISLIRFFPVLSFVLAFLKCYIRHTASCHSRRIHSPIHFPSYALKNPSQSHFATLALNVCSCHCHDSLACLVYSLRGASYASCHISSVTFNITLFLSAYQIQCPS